jgi:hypothetical protein
MTHRISESFESAPAAEPQVDQQPALLVRPAQWWRQRRLDQQAQETIETPLRHLTLSPTLRKGSGHSHRLQRQYKLYWLAFSASARNTPPGWAWRIVYARRRATGELRRLRMLRRVVGDNLPPDPPEPPNLPAQPADARGWHDAAELRSFDEVRAA